MFEMEVVAAALGHKVAPLGFPVHKLDEVPMSEIISKLEDLVTQGEYETVLIPGPSNDADHVITRHACNALIRPHFFAGTVLEYWTWGLPGPFDPVVLHRLTTAELGLKMQAMATYRTQIAAGGVEDDLYPYSMESVKAYAAAAGRLCHAKYAEAYTPRRIVR
jgi:LmbE family N-acetylglucosaminyl deacetylase